MKRTLIILLLLTSLALLVAVESAPSAVVGYVKYDCVAGFNMIALPMDAGYTLSSEAIASYNTADNIDAVMTWNGDGQYWDTAVNYGGNYFDPDPAVAPGSVLYISTSTPFTYYSMGSLPVTNAQYNIVAGYNTLMVPLNRADCNLGSIVASEISAADAVDAIMMWNGAGQYWDTAVNYGGNYFDPDFALTIGTPLYISSAVATTWPAARTATVKPSTNRLSTSHK